jgi:hypothetical protein
MCRYMSSPPVRSCHIAASRMVRGLRHLVTAGSFCLFFFLLTAFGVGLSSRVNAAPPGNDQCFSSETIPGAGPFPYLSAVTDVKDATTAGDPAVPDPLYQSGAEPSRSIWYAFTPSVTAFYTLSTCRDAPTDTTLIDNFMVIYTSAAGCAGPFVQLADSATTRGYADEACGPGFHQAAITTMLQAGVTYYVVVWQFDATVPPAGNTWVQLRVNKVVPPANNTCDHAIGLSVNIPLSGPAASSIGAQNSYQLPTNSSFFFKGIGQIPSIAAGPEVVYTFTAPETANYNFTVRDFSEGSNLVVYVASSCPGSGTPPLLVTNVLAASHRNNYSSSEEIYNLPLTNGQQVYVFVDENVTSLGSGFTIEVNKCFLETEPNNTPETASVLFGGMTGSISNILASDVDFFALGNWPAGSRVFAMLDASAAKTTDFNLQITTTNLVLQYDNEGNDILFGDRAPNIAGTPLPEGPAFIRVNYQGLSVEPYTLYAVVQPPMAFATVETEPNNALAQANSSPINYFSGSLPGPAPSTDIDVFTVNASEGDLIFASLDGDPLRNKTPIDAQLELLDSQGNVLISIDNLAPTSTPMSSTNPASSLSSTTPYSPSEALVYRVRSEGVYYVRVSISPHAPVSAAAGDYLLSISKNCFAGDRNASLPPIIQNVTAAPVNENQSTILSVTFTDPDMSEAHTVVINWGDGQVETSTNLSAGITNYSATHFYPDNPNNPSGNYTANITVLDQYQTSVSTSAPIKVLNVPPANLDFSLTSSSINEGGSVTLSGSFTDPGTLDTHAVSIAWGDGSPNFTANLATGQFVFGATHTFRNNKPGGFSIVVTVLDKDGGSASASTNLTVNNVPPALSNVAITSPITVGSTATLTGNMGDAGALDTFVLTVTWGDGSANTVASYPASTTSFNLTHVYSTAGTNRAVGLSLADSDAGTATGGATITVQQPAKPWFQSIAKLPNGHVQVLLNGATPSVAYTIQTSSTFWQNGWSTLATRTADGSGNIVYEDTTNPLQPNRIYRAVWP